MPTATTIEIGPKTNIRELVEALPIAEEVLSKFGLHCAGCGVNKYETIEPALPPTGCASSRSWPRSRKHG